MIRRKGGNVPKADSSQKALEQENRSMRSALVEIAAENWRFENALEKALTGMDVMEAERFGRQYSYFASRVARAMSLAGLSCLDLRGQIYDVGMAVQGMNLEEFDEDETLVISRMVEPVILWNGSVIREGMVTLEKAIPTSEAEE